MLKRRCDETMEETEEKPEKKPEELSPQEKRENMKRMRKRVGVYLSVMLITVTLLILLSWLMELRHDRVDVGANGEDLLSVSQEGNLDEAPENSVETAADQNN